MSHSQIQKLINNNETWASIRLHLLKDFPPSFHPNKTVEMLDSCRASTKLRQLFPYISLGRLGIWRNDPQEVGKADWFMCLYFYENYYVVSSYDNEEKRFFETAKAAVTFFEQHLNDANPFK